MDQQAPEFVAFAEIDGCVDRFGALFPEPGFGLLEQGIRKGCPIDAFEKADPAERVRLGLIAIVVDESGNTAGGLILVVEQHPLGGFAVSKGLVLIRVEDVLHIALQGGDPVGIVAVNDMRHFMEQSPGVRRLDFDQLHAILAFSGTR